MLYENNKILIILATETTVFDQRAAPAMSKFGKGTSGPHTNSIADLNEDVKDDI